MKRLVVVSLSLVAALGLAAPVFAAEDDGFIVVAHPQTRISVVTRAELSKIFLKRLSTWKNGHRAIPVDQAPESQSRRSFSRLVHDRSVVNVEVYWKRMIFSGRSAPPPELTGDAEVIRFVKETPGAVGYVSPTADLDGVRRLRLAE